MLDRTGSTETPFQYVGGYGYYTGEQGLLNAWHRWYMPEIGKWLSRDPIGSGGNPYTYVEDSPTAFVDATGLAPWLGWRAWWDDLVWDVTHAWDTAREIPSMYQDYYIQEPLTSEFGDPCYSHTRCYLDCMRSYALPAAGLEVADIASSVIWPILKNDAELWGAKRLPGSAEVSVGAHVWGQFFRRIGWRGGRAFMNQRIAQPWSPVANGVARIIGPSAGKNVAWIAPRAGMTAAVGLAGWQAGSHLQCLARCLP